MKPRTARDNQFARILLSACLIVSVPTLGFGYTALNIRSQLNNGSWQDHAMTLQNGIWRTTVTAVGEDWREWLINDNAVTWYDANATWYPPTSANVANPQSGNDRVYGYDGESFTWTAIDGAASTIAVALQRTGLSPVDIVSFSSEVANGGNFDRAFELGDASIGDSVNTVSITLSSAPIEDLFLYYSTDNFASQLNSDVVQVSPGPGTVRTVDIPAQSSGATINYYVFTSEFPEANLDSVGAEIDVLLRALNEDKANQLSYTIYDTGNAFHNVAQTAGSAGERMRAGGNLDSGNGFDGTETQMRIYSGNVFQNATVSRDQWNYVLHYKIGGGAWQTDDDDDFSNESGNDKYWKSTVTLTGTPLGTTISYYLECNYNDAANTFVYDGGSSYITGAEATAQGSPFQFTYGTAPVSGSIVKFK